METLSKYHYDEETKHDAEREAAFHAIMDLTRDALTAKQQEELIKLYVDATHASYWAGWHGHGHAQAKVKVSA
jgi:hypothetical protein